MADPDRVSRIHRRTSGRGHSEQVWSRMASALLRASLRIARVSASSLEFGRARERVGRAKSPCVASRYGNGGIRRESVANGLEIAHVPLMVFVQLLKSGCEAFRPAPRNAASKNLWSGRRKRGHLPSHPSNLDIGGLDPGLQRTVDNLLRIGVRELPTARVLGWVLWACWIAWQ
jgi:hypothetical protein